ncbi:hypothetical protein CPter291_0290 [Collimonas pratensis]|uniref:Uncharacterized protein n=1 Tax=Collimonas pratensis TaxID=279113 RepID=A0ABN4M5I8_9BURK|nr:hypothetical protein CPter291_0290 [Collimonas pratensis]
MNIDKYAPTIASGTKRIIPNNQSIIFPKVFMGIAPVLPIG